MNALTSSRSVCSSDWSPVRDSGGFTECAAWGKTFISAAFPQTVSSGVSQRVDALTLTLHSLLITELHRGAQQTMRVDGGQVIIEYAAVCIMRGR